MVALGLQPAHFTPPQLHSRPKQRTFTRIIRCGIAEPSGEPAPLGQKTKYNDGWFEKAFMILFARKMEKFAAPEKTGMQSKGWFEYDYESFVDVSKRVMQGRNRLQQQQVVREVLLSMLPPGAPAQFRKLFPPTKWAAEFNAALTVPFFHWLVGPSEVVEVEVEGVKQRSGVHIKKCRYLENSGCVGMCVNMCKIPTQDFFTNEFGLPLTMIPNFEDMSCEMVYGQAPPLLKRILYPSSLVLQTYVPWQIQTLPFVLNYKLEKRFPVVPCCPSGNKYFRNSFNFRHVKFMSVTMGWHL